MPKIVIIGGGVSGLSVLHYLNKRYAARKEITIELFEKEIRSGGTATTETDRGWVFERGPNGFMANKSEIRQLCRDLDLEKELIPSAPSVNKRYICIKNRLYPLPQGLLSLLFFRPLGLADKLRIPVEFLVPKGSDPDETVFEFVERRLGKNFSSLLFDPMVNGIYAGDVSKLNLKEAFPRLYELEQKHGSLLWGMLKSGFARPIESPAENNFSKGKSIPILSFRKGMSQLIQALQDKYQNQIFTDREVTLIEKKDGQFQIQTKTGIEIADEIFLCVPAGPAAKLIRPANDNLAEQLAKIQYSPVCVVGLVYRKADLKKPLPPGLGYLVPSSEKKEVLGVLFESQIFPQRVDPEHILLRVMLGGVHHTETVTRSQNEIVETAHQEAQNVLAMDGRPVHHFTAIWPQAIPQYTNHYVPIRMTIEREMYQTKCLHLVSNYLHGVSLNCCVANAQLLVQQSKLLTNV